MTGNYMVFILITHNGPTACNFIILMLIRFFVFLLLYRLFFSFRAYNYIAPVQMFHRLLRNIMASIVVQQRDRF